MIRKRAIRGDYIRIIVPNTDAMAVLPPGTLLSVDSYVADQPNCAMVLVVSLPEAPREYNITVPKGAVVNVVEV